MIDISKFVTVGEDGKAVVDTAAFQSAYDAEIRKATDTNTENTRKKLESEIRKQLAEEAKLNAEEKLAKEKADFEADMAKRLKDFAQAQAKIKMAAAGMDEDEINTYLELVSDDESISKIDKIIDLRTKRTDSLKKEFEKELITKQPNPNANGGSSDAEKSYGATMAAKYQSRVQSEGTKVTAWGN